MRRLLGLLLLFALVLPAAAAPPARARTSAIDGRATRVVDGDSLWFAPAGGGPPIEVRLLGIDAPEICQEGGPEARQALLELVTGQFLQLRVPAGKGGHDVHGRTLGTLYAGEVDLNRRQVEEGWAWSARYKWDQGPYVAQERMAKALRRGVHRGAAVMPRDFRQQHGPCGTASAQPVPSSRPAPADPPRLGAPAAPAAEQAFRCDGRTRCRQMRSCAEAMYFLKHCPGVHLDGDGNGVPCEQQWCGRP